MHSRTGAAAAAVLTALAVLAAPHALSQPPGGGKGGPGGFGGPPGGQERKIVKDFDKNADGWLNKDERVAAREEAKKGAKGGFGFGGKGFGGKGGEGGGKPGPKVSPADVKNVPDAKFYDPTVLRTVFLEFENADWELEMQDFHGTDVEVPATMTVDGKKYPNVGVGFRGMSSYMGVSAGSKRSLNISMDLADGKQRLYGYKTLNLLNANGDASFLSTVLYSQIAGKHIPTPKANFVKVVVNGESWGVYCNVQQFDKVFLEENFKTTKGTRWKVRGSPGGRGGLEYVGDDIAAYKRVFEMKSDEDEKAWKALINLCKVLNQTPADKLPAALEPILDVESLLWFLAADVALINSDGYWTRASDYTIYLDPKGKFHIVPHDMNEAFRPSGGPGFGGGGGMFRFPPPGEVMPPPLQDTLQLTEAQKKELAAIQKDVDAKLEKIMTEEQRKQFKAMREGGPGGFPGGPGGPGGMGPGGPGGAPPGGPGGMGGGRGGVELDPLVGLTDATKPLRSKVLAVPAYRAKYLANVRTIAEDSLDWKKLGPVVADFRKLLDKEIEADTRKLSTYDAFVRATADTTPAPGGMAPGGMGPGGRGPGGGMNLRAFADQRRAYLLTATAPKQP